MHMMPALCDRNMAIAFWPVSIAEPAQPVLHTQARPRKTSTASSGSAFAPHRQKAPNRGLCWLKPFVFHLSRCPPQHILAKAKEITTHHPDRIAEQARCFQQRSPPSIYAAIWAMASAPFTRQRWAAQQARGMLCIQNGKEVQRAYCLTTITRLKSTPRF